MLKQIVSDLNNLANPEKAKLLARFFKTGKDEYGEGDKFIGIMVPQQRQVVKKYYRDISLKEIKNLLSSKIHEYRLTALLILVEKYKKTDAKTKKEIFNFYLKSTKYINNWDLVDVTCPRIVGNYLSDKNRSLLYKLARSKNLWERRMSIISTFAFIDKLDFKDSLKIAKILIHDKHDLIQKAVGWVLREIGKKNPEEEEEFLKKYSALMGRTCLRYAIEKFPEAKRLAYLTKSKGVKFQIIVQKLKS